MPNKKLVFVTGNPFKVEEAKDILSKASVEVIGKKMSIAELQTQDSGRLVRDKALKAFESLRQPLFVEHTGIFLEYLGGLPGVFTQSFWDTLQADRFSEIFGNAPSTNVIARTDICYIDGYRFSLFSGEVQGKISPAPKGNRDFQWDCVFVPDGHAQTFAELGTAKKNEISMRRIALDKLADYIKGLS